MRFPRTLRLDDSDDHAFDRAAAAGEWAVAGGFAFADDLPEALAGKRRQAFRNGFLGTTSFGWSTLVAVTEIDATDYEAVVEALARHLLEAHGAPHMEAARAAARGETEFAAGLCQHKVNTLLAVEREFGPQGVVERFRALDPPREKMHARIWNIVEDERERG